MTDYRYSIDDDGVIRRATIQRFGDADVWSNYWDGDYAVGFYEEYARGRRPLGEGDDSERAISAYQSAKMHGRDPHEALDILAVRLTGDEDSRFIVVPLDRGCDLYVLAWGGDPNNEWRDEIEALNNGEVYRIEVEQQLYDGTWLWDESDYESYYGEDNAEAELRKQFDLDEYPAEVHVGARTDPQDWVLTPDP